MFSSGLLGRTSPAQERREGGWVKDELWRSQDEGITRQRPWSWDEGLCCSSVEAPEATSGSMSLLEAQDGISFL